MQPRPQGGRIVESVHDVATQPTDLLRQLSRSTRRLAEPEGDRGRRALGVHHAHGALLDAANAPRRAAQQEDVARHALHGEVLVHRADHRVVGLGDDLVVARLGNRPAVHDGGQARAPLTPHDPVNPVPVDERRGPTGAVTDATRQHLDDLIEVAARELRVRLGGAHEIE